MVRTSWEGAEGVPEPREMSCPPGVHAEMQPGTAPVLQTPPGRVPMADSPRSRAVPLLLAELQPRHHASFPSSISPSLPPCTA